MVVESTVLPGMAHDLSYVESDQILVNFLPLCDVWVDAVDVEPTSALLDKGASLMKLEMCVSAPKLRLEFNRTFSVKARPGC